VSPEAAPEGAFVFLQFVGDSTLERTLPESIIQKSISGRGGAGMCGWRDISKASLWVS
jgi:hypothetical protein